MSCILHFVVFHAYFRKLLLRFSSHQVIYSAFFIAICAEVACKGIFLIQQHSKEQGQPLVCDHSQHCFEIMLLYLRMYFHSISQNYLTFAVVAFD